MIKRLIFIVVVLPIALVLLALAVANRQEVALNWNPFRPDFPGHQVAAPMFVFLFLVFALGMIVGSMATWLRQSRYRKQARAKQAEVEEWRYKADRERERAQALAQTVVEERKTSDASNLPSKPRQRPMTLLGAPR